MHAAHCVIIEDDPDFLAFTVDVVGSMCPSLKLTGFDSAIDAIEFLRANSVDLILTDFRMPFVDGLRLIAAVRLVDRDVPIIMMSGEPVESAALAAGANAFVLKPALLRQLGTILGSLGLPVDASESVSLRK